MEIEDFLGEGIENKSVVTNQPNKPSDKAAEKIGQEQFYDIITSKDASWQAIIYELIQSEQLDPWDIDLATLAQKYLERIKALEEANFFISSKVLLAASLLLRIKSEILLNQQLRSLDDILFGKKEEKKSVMERIEIDSDELPELIPRTPLPRFRPVSLNELLSALGKAINTENRRIKKEVVARRAEQLSQVDILKVKVNIRDRIRQIYAKIKTYFSREQTRLAYTALAGTSREDKIAAFLPVLHLENQQKIWLEQEKHFDEIWIWLYSLYRKEHPVEEIEQEIQEEIKEMDSEEKKRIEQVNADFENPLAELFDEAEEEK
jgi:segregation and condensation protein A